MIETRIVKCSKQYRRGVLPSSALCYLALSIQHLAFFLLPLPCPAAEIASAPQFASATLGFDGRYKLGCWTPLDITLHGGTQDTRGSVIAMAPDADGVPVRFQTEAFPLRAGEALRLPLCVKLGRHIEEVTVAFVPDEGSGKGRTHEVPIAATRFAIKAPLVAEARLFVHLGPPIADAQGLARFGRNELVTVNEIASLPTRWVGYEGVDALIVSTREAALLTQWLDDPVRWLAVERWLAAGGKVIFCADPQAETVLRAETPLARWLPGKFVDMVSLTRSEAFETYSGSAQRLATTGRGESFRLQVPRLENIHGVVEAAEGKLPLIVRQARGLGQLMFVAVPLSDAPFASWTGRNLLAARLLALPAARETSDVSEESLSQQAHLHGLSDISAQLFAALDHFGGVVTVPFWTMVGLAVVYLALIGPGDFWLVKRLLRRLELTWMTLPLLAAASAAAILIAIAALKGHTQRVNQLDLLDVDLSTQSLRGTSWLSLLAPRTSAYDLSLSSADWESDAKPVDRDEALAWFAPDGSGWGGMHGTVGNATEFVEPYALTPTLNRLDRVPVETWNSKSFCARWTSTASGMLEADLHPGVEGSLRGQISHHLPVTLNKCQLLYGRHGYELGDLPPGASIEVPTHGGRDLETVLKQFQVVKNAKNNSFLQAPLPYDPAGLDVPTILRTMMFYEVLAGRQYTGLAAAQQRFVDASPLLALGCAVLVGQWDHTPGSAVTWRDGETPLVEPSGQRWTFVRFVIPVK